MHDEDLITAYRQAGDESPPPALDARIRAAAAAAVKSPPPRRFRLAWLVPASVTVVTILGVAVTLRVFDEEARLRSESLKPTAPAASEAVPAQSVQSAPAARSAPSAVGASPSPAPAAETATGRSDVVPRAFPPAPRGSSAVSPDAAGAAASMAPSPAERGVSGVPAADAMDKQAPAARMPAPPSIQLQRSGPDANAERRLADIRALIEAGHRDAARVALRQFRIDYPGHPLPKDLQALADE